MALTIIFSNIVGKRRIQIYWSQNITTLIYLGEICSIDQNIASNVIENLKKVFGFPNKMDFNTIFNDTKSDYKDENVDKLKCCICFNKFSTVEKCVEHILQIHEGQKFVYVNGKPKFCWCYYCNVCFGEFTSEQSFRNHCTSVHKLDGEAKKVHKYWKTIPCGAKP